ncbi:hypothetical protein B7P43_G07037 [Cryptotermes secundus]|uniref:Uncharacterized protein n=1 Tax=Cryptotermes secundus TaxID=105785 RepID=A0A2J7RDP9_9NEOP|nr:hypothetical protein B7P43_G07037 [Cryptotermes secundus]
MFAFTEAKPGLAMIKLQLKAEIDRESDGTTDPEPDDEQDSMALNTEREGSVVEQEDLLWHVAFLEVEIKAEDDIWSNAAETMKVDMDCVTRDEQHGVHLKDLNGVGKMTCNEYVELNTERRGPRKHFTRNMSEEKLEKRRERDRLRKRRYGASRSQDAIARERERIRLNRRKIRVSLKYEEIKRQRETERTHTKFPDLSEGDGIEMWYERIRKYKRKPVAALTSQQLERQRERNRTYMRKYRASLSAEELERRREKDRLQKRKAREVIKHQKQDITHSKLQCLVTVHEGGLMK